MSLSDKERNRRYYLKHREELLAKRKTPEALAKRREYDREYRKRHPEKNKVKTKKWRQTHPEKVKEYSQKYKERQKELWATPKYKSMLKKSRDKYRKNNPEKHQAHIALNNAIARGDIIRKPCIKCGNPKSEGHHEDYSRPLEVIWLCRKCHYLHHKERRQQCQKNIT